MMDKRYWSREELISYLRLLSEAYGVDAHREEDAEKRGFYRGKSEAYEQAAFDIEHNLEAFA